MHRPGYVQGGQEAKRGYLLLGVYHRRIPGFTATHSLWSANSALYIKRETSKVTPYQVQKKL
jgi:hypothetical protein